MNRWRVIFVALLLCTNWLAFAQPRITKPAQPYRFLFLVDTSFSMHSWWNPSREIVQNTISGGFKEQIKPDDGFGIWTFNHEVFPRKFPVLNWDPLLNQALANTAAQFLKIQPVENDTRFDRAVVELSKLVRVAEKLTIVMVSDLDELKGTPYDLSINSWYRAHKKRTTHQKSSLRHNLPCLERAVPRMVSKRRAGRHQFGLSRNPGCSRTGSAYSTSASRSNPAA